MNVWERIGALTQRHARATLAGVAAATLALGASLLRLEVDTSFLGFVRPETRELVETIEDDFDEGCYLTVIFESGSGRSLLEPELLHRQLRILREIEAAWPVTTFSLVEGIDLGLRRVRRQSLLETHDYSTVAEAILGLAGGRTVRDLEKVSAHFISPPDAVAFYRRLRVAQAAGGFEPPGAPDFRYRVPPVRALKALVRTEPGESRRERREMLAAIRDRLAARSTPDLALHVLNDELVSHDMDRDTRRSVVLLGVMVFAVDVLCVASLFRSRREVFVVFAVLVTACVWTFGLAGLVGMRLSFLHLLGIPILLGTGVDDTLIFGRRLLEEQRAGRPFADALRASYAGTGNAIFLTTFTTFLAFLATGLTARADVFASFFLLVSVSMAIVLVLTLLLEGALRSELAGRGGAGDALPVLPPPSPLEAVNRRLVGLARRVMDVGPRPLLIAGAVLLGLAALSASQLGGDMSRRDLLQPGSPTWHAHEALQEHFGDSRVGYVLVSGAVESPTLLKKLGELEARLADVPSIEKVLGSANTESVTALLAKLDVAVTPETDVRALLDRLRADERTADYAVDMSFSEAADHVVRRRDGPSGGYDGLLLRFFVRGESASHALAAVDAIRREVADLGLDRAPGVEVRVGGGDVVYPLESVYYVEVLVETFFLSLAANFLVLLAFWRRAGRALLALAPLVVATAIVVGAMPLFGLTLNPLNLGIGAIIVGLGIDHPIHLMERWAEERRVHGRSARDATRVALDATGPHMLAGTLTTAAGFCASCVLLLPVTTSFGLLTGAAMGIVYLASLLVLPALLARPRAADASQLGQ